MWQAFYDARYRAMVAKALLKYNIGSCRLDNKRANDMVGELILHRPIVEWENVCYNDIVEYFQQLQLKLIAYHHNHELLQEPYLIQLT